MSMIHNPASRVACNNAILWLADRGESERGGKRQNIPKAQQEGKRRKLKAMGKEEKKERKRGENANILIIKKSKKSE